MAQRLLFLAPAMDLNANTSLWTGVLFMLSLALLPGVLLTLGWVALSRFHPEPFEMTEVQKLARDLNEAADLALQEATHAFSSRPGERRALEDLIRLADMIEGFRYRVNRSMKVPSSTQNEFLRLQARFDQVAADFRKLTAHQVFGNVFIDLIHCMDSLRFYYSTKASTARPPGVSQSIVSERNARGGRESNSVETLSLE